jgi:hypothetical protein
MTATPTTASDYDAIAETVQRYVDGGRSGRAADMKPAFHPGATIFGPVRLELDNWTGHRFTDMFTLLKVDGEWKIISKVFHLHP